MLRGQSKEGTSTYTEERKTTETKQTCITLEKPPGDGARTLIPCTAGWLAVGQGGRLQHLGSKALRPACAQGIFCGWYGAENCPVFKLRA